MINIDQFHSVDIRIGHILSAEKVPETDKLLKLSVDFGPKSSATESSPDHSALQNGLEKERDIRQIVSGIAPFFEDIQTLVGKKCAFVANLEPRTIKGLESHGMILAAHTEDAFSLLEVSPTVLAGTRIN
jgi:methionyl-tRNA synthetase